MSTRGLGFEPAAAHAGGGLVLVDYQDLLGPPAKADASGAATVALGPPPAGVYWLIEKVTIASSDGSGTSCVVYKGDPQLANICGGSSRPGLDFDDADPPYLVTTSPLTFVFAGVTAGATVIVRAQCQVVVKGSR